MQLQEPKSHGGLPERAIEVRAFGAPDILVDGESVAAELPAKAIALLVHLADQPGPVGRSTMAGLLWSDSTEDRARNSLRVALSRMRSVLGEAVVADRSSVQFFPSAYDVAQRKAFDPLDRPELYVNKFLDSFEPPDAELFCTWAEARRGELHVQAVTELTECVAAAKDERDWARTRELASMLLAIDPWFEPAHRATIEALANTTGSSAAIAHYDQFATSLEAELGITPEAETRELITKSRARSARSLFDDRVPLPLRPTQLFGRTDELRRLDDLVEPGRPVSIVGPGGIGKSRLMIEYAIRRQRRGHDVTYVTFDGDDENVPADAARAVAESVLDVLGLSADGQRSAIESLQRALADRDGVLCLDNIDSLGDVSAVVATLARQCPSLEVLIATRRRLTLTRGHVLALGGLLPGPYEAGSHPAVELFFESARQLEATHSQRTTVAAICDRLGGHPLAIELAAHVAETSPLHDVLERIERTVDLSAPGSDLIDRHQSLQELVQASTAQVSRPARTLLGSLTCFAGSFTPADADAVSSDAAHLDELVGHSLVQFDGRDYRIHAIIRDHLRARLTQREAEGSQARHAGRMLELCATGARSGRLRVELQGRHEDLRRAAAWRITQGPAEGLGDDLRPYLAHQRSWGWVASTLETTDQALARTDLSDTTRAELHRHAAEALFHAGELDRAEHELQGGLEALGQELHDRPGRRARAAIDSLGALASDRLRRVPAREEEAAELSRLMSLYGELLYISDRRAEMTSYAAGAVLAGRRSRDPTLVGAGDIAVSIAAQLAGAAPVARQAARRGRPKVMGPTADPFTAALSRATCALIAASAGEFGQARSDASAAIDAARAAGRPRHVVLTELLLALVAFHEQCFDEVLDRLDETAARIDRIGYQPALPWVHGTRAETFLSTGLGDARREADEALRSAEVLGAPADVGRARMVLAGCALPEDPAAATGLVRSARSALEQQGSTALQYSEAICRCAELSVTLGAQGRISSSDVDRSVSRMRRLARSIPLAKPRLAALVAARP